MVDHDPFRRFLVRTGIAPFPAYEALPAHAALMHSVFVHPLHDWGSDGESDPFRTFEIVPVLHGSLSPEWPITPHVPSAMRGYRHALGLSQARLAAALDLNRPNIERWERGLVRPFRGNNLALLSLLRPLVDSQLAAGQLLNIVAAAVCPHLTRPAGRYTRGDVEALLVGGADDHRDLATPLLDALVHSEILMATESDTDDPETPYIPLVGVAVLDVDELPAQAELRSLARSLAPQDLQTLLALGRRLAQH